MTDKGHGWVMFSAVVLAVAGIMRLFDAIWAFRYHVVLAREPRGSDLRPQAQDLRLGVPGCGSRPDALGDRSHERLASCRWVGIVAGAIATVDPGVLVTLLPSVEGIVACPPDRT